MGVRWHRWVCVVVLVLGGGIWGCSGQPAWKKDAPDDVLKAFLSAAESQDLPLAWEFLGHSTREALASQAASFNAAHPNLPPREGADMLRFGRMLSSTREYKKFEVTSADADKAMVSIVLHDAAQINVELRRESGRWVIDLPVASH